MANVYANGLEISGKGSDGKTIAVFPDVCFTPPENPATPPGVPVPYPSFGTSGDTENGTSTVKIAGKVVNLKNKSDLSKTTGTEAGCAAKKGIITSKNTGKEYFRSWSNDVKFDGEPVIRFSDLATNNHGSEIANTAPWAHVLKRKKGGETCEKIIADCKLQLHKHHQNPCDSDNKVESEHMCQNAFFQNSRGGPDGSIPDFPKYSANTAPCICMQGPSTVGDTPHGKKTANQREFAKNWGESKTVEECVTSEIDNIRNTHPNIKGEKGERALKCLEEIIYAYLEAASEQEDGSKRSGEALKKTPLRKPRGGKITEPSANPLAGVE